MKKTIILLSCLLFSYESSFSAIETRPILTLKVANEMTKECLKLAKDKGWRIVYSYQQQQY